VFDTSPRMDYIHTGRSRLEVAQQFAEWIVSQMPRESKIAVIDCRPGPAAFQVDRRAALDRIDRLETHALCRPLPERIEQAAELLQASPLENRELFVFSDLTEEAWPRQSVAWSRQLAGNANWSLYVVDVGVRDPVNTRLGDLQLSGQVLPEGATLQISTQVLHRGDNASRTVALYLEQPAGHSPTSTNSAATGTEAQSRGKEVVQLAEGKPQAVRFHLAALDLGVYQGYVEIAEPDGLQCDNRRYFTVQVRRPWPVLIAAPEPADRYAFFLRQMLAPSALERINQVSFRCRVVALSKLAETKLDDFAAVLLVDPTRLDDGVWNKLLEYVRSGGGVAVLLGRNAAAIESFNGEAAQRLLAGRLLRQARRPEAVVLAPERMQHPMLAPLAEYEKQIPWHTGPVFRYWQLAVPEEGVQVVVPFSDGKPAILERRIGDGRVVTVVTPLSDPTSENPWNLLPSGDCWPMLVLVNQMTLYLTGSSETRWNYLPGQTVSLPVTGNETSSTGYRVEPLDGSGPPFRVQREAGNKQLVFPCPEELGNYRVLAADGTQQYGFSVNLPARQTRLDRLDQQQLAQRLGNLPLLLVRNRQQLQITRSVRQTGRELYEELILLLVLLFAAEHYLANRFYGDSRAHPRQATAAREKAAAG